MRSKYCLIVLAILSEFCGGCVLERKAYEVAEESNLSTTSNQKNVATIDAGKAFAFCYISYGDVKAVRLTIDPGPISMTVHCGSDFRSSKFFFRDFEFYAEGGHDYKVEYEFYRCMRLKDKTSRSVISDSCSR